VRHVGRHLRFSVIGQLLAAPPPKGDLRAQIEALAGHQWRHPITGEPVRFGFSTIERWFYRALKERSDPVGVLHRKLRTDAGQQPAMSDAVRQLARLPLDFVDEGGRIDSGKTERLEIVVA